MLLKLKETIQKKWSGILMLDKNVRSHLTTVMQNHIAILGFESLHHLPYSPDFTPSDFYLFLASKKYLGVILKMTFFSISNKKIIIEKINISKLKKIF